MQKKKYNSTGKYDLIFPLFKFLVCVFLNSPLFAQTQATYYVSPGGNDNNPGTIGQPFATLQKARDAVEKINIAMTGDILIYLRGGVYRLESTFDLSSHDSGSNGHNIIYQAYNCEKPVISGGLNITGWVLHDTSKNIYRAIVDPLIDSRQLYVNGVRAIRARSIDGSGWRENEDGYDCPIFVSSWKNIKDIEVVSYSFWKCHRGPIDSMKNMTHAVMAQPYWDNLHQQLNAPPAWIENAYELLDSEGEWFLDRKNKTVYYKPRTGEDIVNAEVIVPRLEILLNGSGVSNVQFKGITFEFATWTLPNTSLGFPCIQADQMFAGPDWQATQMTGNIVFDHCSNIKLENNIFEHLGTTALQFNIGCKNNCIYNNIFRDISGSAISIGGLTNPNPSEIDLVKGNVIDNNLIRNVAIEYKGCVGIFIGYTEQTTITHNEISYLPYSGISVGWDWNNSTIAGKNNDISYNHVDSIMMELIDGGGIYTLSSQPGTQVHHNYISNQYNAYGALYLDEGSSNMHWYNNVVRNVPMWLHMWKSDIQKDTVDFNFYDCENQITNGSNCVIINNVFVSNNIWPAEAIKIMKDARRIFIRNKLTGLSMTKSSSVLHVNESLQLAVNFNYCDSIYAGINWISSDPFIASVNSDGLINAKSLGKTTIIMSTRDNSMIDSLELNVVLSTGIQTILKLTDIFYPNPATDKLYIKYVFTANAIITIFDLQGKQVYHRQINDNVINISNLSKGLYIVRLNDSGKILTSKFLKE